MEILDGALVSTAAGALRVGTRIAVQWSDPWRWESGVIIELITRLERKATAVEYKIAYDDGSQGIENFRQVVARLEAPGEWHRVSLQCGITHARLLDAARGGSCSHLPQCNLAALAELCSTPHAFCPIANCNAKLSRRSLVRDEHFSALVAAAPEHVTHAWHREGCEELQVREEEEEEKDEAEMGQGEDDAGAKVNDCGAKAGAGGANDGGAEAGAGGAKSGDGGTKTGAGRVTAEGNLLVLEAIRLLQRPRLMVGGGGSAVMAATEEELETVEAEAVEAEMVEAEGTRQKRWDLNASSSEDEGEIDEWSEEEGAAEPKHTASAATILGVAAGMDVKKPEEVEAAEVEALQRAYVKPSSGAAIGGNVARASFCHERSCEHSNPHTRRYPQCACAPWRPWNGPSRRMHTCEG